MKWIFKKIAWIGAFIVGFALFMQYAPNVFPQSAWAYATAFQTNEDHVHIAKQPGDCEFLHAPIGNKDCHYKKVVQVTLHNHNQNGQPIISYDNGVSWQPDESRAVQSADPPSDVYVTWERIND